MIPGRYSSVNHDFTVVGLQQRIRRIKCFSLSVLHLVCRHLADHVVEDASVVEIRQLHVRIESHPYLECFSCVEL